MKILIEQIIASAVASDEEVFDVARARIKKTRALSSFGDMYIYKRSVDARHKDSIKLVYSVCAEVESVRGKENADLTKFGIKRLCFPHKTATIGVLSISLGKEVNDYEINKKII